MSGGEAAPAPIFLPDAIVAGRYRIQRYLGQGAAGEVYGAEDLHLRSRIALKVLRPGASRDPQSIERFKREILLARRVSHPNICRIFDFGMHEVASAEQGGTESVFFLTMEWLEGETLARRIQEEGALDEAPAVAIVRQLCRGLTAAHDAGVIHRDLKSSNILLVPAAEASRSSSAASGPHASEGERAVITDFGLARSSHQSSDGITLTETGGLLGTPAYMAPEQVAGLAATSASDIYALGVVLYEMLTGSLPFHGESPLEVAVKRLREPPTPIETYRTGISARFRATIERCMAREPEERFASADEVIRYLDPPTVMLRAERQRRQRLPRALLIAGAIVAAGGLVVAGLRYRGILAGDGGGERAGAATAADSARVPGSTPRRAIAVLGFANATGRPEAQWLSSALSEMLTSELAATDSVRAVPGEVIAQARQDLDLSLSSALGVETLERLRRILGADLVLLGSFTAQGGTEAPLRLDLRLQATDGSYTKPFSIEGSEAKIFALVRQGGESLRNELGIASLESAAVPALEVAHPASPEAVRLYAGGLEAMRSFETGKARELLERSIATDPEFPLARAALAAAWWDLGYDELALAAASEARQRSARLSRSDQLMIEGLERRLSRDWPRAIEVADTLWRFYPDDLEHGLRLAQVELEAGESTAALATIAELRKLPPPPGEDPRIDLVEAGAAAARSDFHRQLTIAERAASRAESAGSRSILARALFEQGAAERKLGAPDRAAAHFETARRLAGELGDRAFVAVVSQALANLERARGDLAVAQVLFEESRATFEAIGNRRRAARVEISLGLVASERGDLEGAERLYAHAESALTELGDRRGAAAAAANLGTMLYLQWDLAGAETRHQQALATFRQLGDRSREMVPLANLGQIRRERGDFPGSDRFWQQALELARATGDKTGEGDALVGQGENRALQGDAVAARRDLDAARALFEAGGEKPKAAAVRLVQARLEREAGESARAFAALVALAQEFGARGEAGEKVQADLEAARCLLDQHGKSPAAAELAREALGAAERSPSAGLRHLGRLVSAEVDTAFGRYARARATLKEDLAIAERAGHRIAALEARLGALAIERAAGAAIAEAEARSNRALTAFASEARGAGCGALASRADRLAATSVTGALAAQR